MLKANRVVSRSIWHLHTNGARTPVWYNHTRVQVGWMVAALLVGAEESPPSAGQRCRLTAGRGNPTA